MQKRGGEAGMLFRDELEAVASVERTPRDIARAARSLTAAAHHAWTAATAWERALYGLIDAGLGYQPGMALEAELANAGDKAPWRTAIAARKELSETQAKALEQAKTLRSMLK